MTEQKWVNVDENYLNELEEKAKKTDFLEGYIKGTEVVFAFAEDLVKALYKTYRDDESQREESE